MSAIEDTLVEFRSSLGNTILYPSRWSAESKETSFSIKAPNSQAVISGLTFTKQGSGTLREFGQRVVDGVCGSLPMTEWRTTQIGECVAQTRESDVDVEGVDAHWRIYVLECGECLHALVLEALPTIMVLNGLFYEQLIQTFRGISSTEQPE